MENAACLLARLKPARNILREHDFVQAAWPAAVGKRLASRARILRLDNQRLLVAVEDALWQQNLQSLSSQILDNLKNLIGPAAPLALEFVVAPLRRPPHNEERPAVPLKKASAAGQ